MNEAKQSCYNYGKNEIYKDACNPDAWTRKIALSDFTLEQFDFIVGRIRKDLVLSYLNSTARREPEPDIPDEYEASDNDDPDAAPYNSAAPIQSHTCINRINPTSTNRRPTTIFDYTATPETCSPID